MKIKKESSHYPGNEKKSLDSEDFNSLYDEIYKQLSPEETKRRRNFTMDDRTALLILADGRCQICGDVLGDDWEPDHIVPFSKGGLTDVTNGQALCKSCNRKKGAR